jgi:hypothetical protein
MAIKKRQRKMFFLPLQKLFFELYLLVSIAKFLEIYHKEGKRKKIIYF